MYIKLIGLIPHTVTNVWHKVRLEQTTVAIFITF